jgi:hypothetical protein
MGYLLTNREVTTVKLSFWVSRWAEGRGHHWRVRGFRELAAVQLVPLVCGPTEMTMMKMIMTTLPANRMGISLFPGSSES